MRYRRLGKTDLKVSVVGIGTWQFGGEWGKDFTQGEVDLMFDRARDLGLNLIDTAECYGDHASEALIGQAISRDRGNWVVATKFGHRFLGHMNRTDERSAADVETQLEDSLKALKTDYIDLYQYHSVRDAEFGNPELRAVLDKAVQSGKVRYIGNSISNSGAATDGFDQVEASTAAHVATIQIVYNRLDRRPEQRVFASCRTQDLGVLARVPLASGLLSGKYHPGATFPEGDVRHGHDRAKMEERLREIEQIRQKEVPAGVPMAQWALAWCLQHPAVTTVIPGCKDVKQLESNAAAAQLPSVSYDHPQAWE